MDYIVIDQEDLSMVSPVECGDIPAVKRIILEKIKAGRTPRVFEEIPFDIKVSVLEVPKVETTTHKAKPDKVARGPGDSAVRPGDEGAAEAVDKGSGDSSADSGAKD